MDKIYFIAAYTAKFLIFLVLVAPTSILAQTGSPAKSDYIIKQVNFGVGNVGLTETIYDLENPSEDDDIDLDHLKSLIFDNVPTIFLINRNIQDENEKFPQRLISDVNSLYLLEGENERIRSVKLLQIDIYQNQENSSVRLNPEKLAGLNNLTHVFIKSNFALTKEEVNQMVSGFNKGDLILLYQVNTNF
jgi:hypothetical protein